MNENLNEAKVNEIAQMAHGIRERVLAHTLKNNGGYMSQACSAAELLATLYGAILSLDPLDQPLAPSLFSGVPARSDRNILDSSKINFETGARFHGEKKPELDRLISSPAHYALVIYAALIESGRLSEDALDFFNKDGSTVEMIGAEHSPGFETTTGSLAQALSQAGGIALGRKLKNESGRTWVFMSDGELQEGQSYEALQAISFYKLNKVRAIVDVNQGQCDGPMESVMSIEPIALRVKAFGWDCVSVDGHDIEAIYKAAMVESGKPRMILCYTDPVRGLPILSEREPVLHYLRFTSDEERAKYQLAFQEMVTKS
jgi:transketolase